MLTDDKQEMSCVIKTVSHASSLHFSRVLRKLFYNECVASVIEKCMSRATLDKTNEGIFNVENVSSHKRSLKLQSYTHGVLIYKTQKSIKTSSIIKKNQKTLQLVKTSWAMGLYVSMI